MSAAAVIPQAELLASAPLRINEKLIRGEPERGSVILRAVGRERRMVVSPAQAEFLTERFAERRTVPEVLVRTIGENRCPPLREFYELVVQAHAAGILQSGPSGGAEPPALRWPVKIPAPLAVVVAGGTALVSAAFLAFSLPRWSGPDRWLDVVTGWLVACALLSLGQLLAACAVAACGEVRASRLFWRTRFPHFRIDTGEAIMGGRTCEVAVAALRAAPILAGAALVLDRAPGWFPALCGGAIYVLAPFGHSAARQALAARRKTPQYSVRADFMFEPVRADLWVRGVARWRSFQAEFGWGGAAWALVWCTWAVVAFTHCMPKTAATLTAWVKGAPPPVHLGAEYLLVAAIALGVLAGGWAALKHWRLQRAWSRPLRGADARGPARPALTGEPAAMLAQVPLFQGLDEAGRAEIAAAMEFVTYGRRDVIVREDDPGDDFYLIVEGEVEVRKRLPKKRRSTTIGWLGPGECFGEIALLEKTTRTATIVARRPTRLLKLGRTAFESLVVNRIGAASIRELLQHARFLGRFVFAADWPFPALVTFARRCRSVQVEADTAVLTRGERNHWFYLIYDGAFEAQEGKRVLRRMGPGDCFGEISLLEGWEATATVVAIEESRCLALSRPDFLELFAREFRIGLRIEALAGQRLGAPVFAAR
jgi:CRP-like cAMP-binding protein